MTHNCMPNILVHKAYNYMHAPSAVAPYNCERGLDLHPCCSQTALSERCFSKKARRDKKHDFRPEQNVRMGWREPKTASLVDMNLTVWNFLRIWAIDSDNGTSRSAKHFKLLIKCSHITNNTTAVGERPMSLQHRVTGFAIIRNHPYWNRNRSFNNTERKFTKQWFQVGNIMMYMVPGWTWDRTWRRVETSQTELSLTWNQSWRHKRRTPPWSGRPKASHVHSRANPRW